MWVLSAVAEADTVESVCVQGRAWMRAGRGTCTVQCGAVRVAVALSSAIFPVGCRVSSTPFVSAAPYQLIHPANPSHELRLSDGVLSLFLMYVEKKGHWIGCWLSLYKSRVGEVWSSVRRRRHGVSTRTQATSASRRPDRQALPMVSAQREWVGVVFEPEMSRRPDGPRSGRSARAQNRLGFRVLCYGC
jgi:hypothetical protein